MSLPAPRVRRGRNLFERLRPQREPVSVGSGEDLTGQGIRARGAGEVPLEPKSYDFLGAIAGAQGESSAVAPGPGEEGTIALTSGELKVERALEVFNAGEHPRRVAGVARSLGEPSVTVRPVADSGSVVAIVVAWELCWYRYEVDLGDEAAGARVTAQGTELSGARGGGPACECHSRRARRAVASRCLSCTLAYLRLESRIGGLMIYCVVPKPLAEELYPKLLEHYQHEDNVTVIVDRREFDRRARRGSPAATSVSSRGCAAARRPRPPQGPRGRGYAPARTRCPRSPRVSSSADLDTSGDEGDRARRRRRSWQPWAGGGRVRDHLARGRVLGEHAQLLGTATNNVAEYRALLLGLQRARELGASEIEVVGDSELIAKQVKGLYKVKHEAMRPLHREAMAALGAVRALVDPDGAARAERARRRARQRRAGSAAPPSSGAQCSGWAERAMPSICALESSSSSVFVSQYRTCPGASRRRGCARRRRRSCRRRRRSCGFRGVGEQRRVQPVGALEVVVAAEAVLLPDARRRRGGGGCPVSRSV